MHYCMSCGAQVPATARFCPDCGAPSAGRDAEATRVAPSEETRVSTSLPRPVVPTPRPAAPVAQRQPPATPARDGETERVVFVVRPTLLFVKLGYALAALAGLLLVAAFSYFFEPPWPYVSLALAVALLLVPVYHHVRRNLKKYTLTDAKIEIDEGFISQTTRNMPLRNIRDVTVKTTIFQRMLGFGDVVIDNAGEEGGPTVLDNIPEPRRHMDLILRELRRWR